MKKITELEFNQLVDAIWKTYLLQASAEDIHKTVMRPLQNCNLNFFSDFL